MEPNPSARMQSYILRAWQDGAPENSWRFRIIILQTGEAFGFKDLESLQSFLQEVFIHSSGSGESEADKGQ